MRHLIALGAACAVAGAAAAQSGTVSGGVTTTRAGAGSMPGQQVGTGLTLPGGYGHTTHPVGSKLPAAATPLSRPYDPNRPLDQFQGTGISPNQVIAPITPYPSAPEPEKNLIDRLYDKLGSVLTFSRPGSVTAVQRPPNVTPGIFRRNRERAEERTWRRD